jgi:uncharacterized protein
MAKVTRAASMARFILVVTALLLPTLSLLPLGGLYLWEKGYLLWWAIAAFLCVLLVTLAQRLLLGGSVSASIDVPGYERAPPSAAWSPLEEKAWDDVCAIAASANLDQIGDPQTFLDLGLKTIEAVSQRLHPEKMDSLWRFTLPEALTISERVSRRLAVSVTTHIPFGDSMTLAQFWAIYRWRRSIEVAERAYDIWRLLRFANPATALTHEARDRLSRALLQWGREHVSRRIAETFVEEVGRAAIDLYGGRLKGVPRRDQILDSQPVGRPGTPANGQAPPLRVLVSGASQRIRTAVADELELLQIERLYQPNPVVQADDSTVAVASGASTRLEIFEARSSQRTSKAISNLVQEVATADIVLWLFDLKHGIAPFDHDVFAAVAKYFASRPDLRAPIVIPAVIRQSLAEATAGGENATDIMAQVTNFAARHKLEPPLSLEQVIGPEAGPSISQLWQNILEIGPRARRVHAIRQIASQKTKGSRLHVPKQALSAMVALGKSLTRRDRPKSSGK